MVRHAEKFAMWRTLSDRLSNRGTTASPRRMRAELLIDCEEDRTLRAVLVGMLREGDGESR